MSECSTKNRERVERALENVPDGRDVQVLPRGQQAELLFRVAGLYEEKAAQEEWDGDGQRGKDSRVAAISLYRRVADEFLDSDLREEAKKRMMALIVGPRAR